MRRFQYLKIIGVKWKYEIIALEIVNGLNDILHNIQKMDEYEITKKISKLQIKSVMREIIYGVCPRKKRMSRSISFLTELASKVLFLR